MPFKSDAQRKYLWSQKPEVAKQIAYKNHGGEMMDDRKPSKVIKKDRYGNQITFEYAPEMKPLDPTALAKHAMDNDMEVPEISMIDMDEGHPGEPMGSDTVPAWLTPGEFVVNAEAMRIPGAKEAVEQINDQGRAMQQMQGGSIPSMGYDEGGSVDPLSIFNPLNLFSTPEERRQAEEYKKYHVQPKKEEPKLQISPIDILKLGLGFDQGGNVPFIAGPRLNDPSYMDEGGEAKKKKGGDFAEYFKNPKKYEQPPVDVGKIADKYFDDGGWVTDELLDKLMEVESGGREDAVSPAGAVGLYQWLPSSAAKPGYGVKAFDPKDKEAARKATKEYLKGMQKYHGFSPEETLRAYNWGPGNVIKHKKGTRKDIPDEALNYPGKILGIENTVGVPAPEGMPVPIARPGSIQAEAVPTPKLKPSVDVPTPTPRPQPEEEWQVVKDLRSMWDAIKGPRYKQEGGITKPHFDTLAANYTPPELPSNVVPELTDVPKGHQMFGGNQNIAGDVVPQGPEKFEPSFWDKYVLGPKTKSEHALTEDDKGFLDQKTSESELLASDQLAEEENQIADEYVPVQDVESDIVNEVMDSEVNNAMVDEIKTDDFKKAKVAGELTDEIALNEAKNKKEVQSGPDKNQPGENKSEEEVVKAGEGANKGVLDAAKNSLVSAFGDLFDSKELARMGILYAGSRLLGYSHGGSLQYAAKQYLTRVDAKAAGHDKYVKELTKSGKYSTKSIAAYNKSKDINDLIPVGTPINPTGNFKTFYGPNGKQVRAQSYKVGKATVWKTPDGKTINANYKEDASAVPGTKEYGERVKKDTSLYTNMIKDLRSQFGTTPVEGGKDLYATELAPTIAGGKVAKWAADNNIPAEYMGSIVENAYHSALTHGKDTGEKVRDLTPFLEEQWVISQVGDSTLFKNKDGGQISGTNVSNLISQIQNAAGRKGKTADTPTLIAAYRKAWNGLDAKEQDLWNAKATENENGFMKFVQNDITKSVM